MFKQSVILTFCITCILLITNKNPFVVAQAQANIWQGKWFPNSPNETDENPTVILNNSNLYDPKHGVKMGVSDPDCDNGKSRLEVDWIYDPVNFTCLSRSEKIDYRSHSNLPAIYSADKIPDGYSAHHKCMDKTIHYHDVIPTFGSHRPLWAKYGEYVFLPPQRWLHNLEHGAIAMLFHPCADPNEVNLLRKLVTGCLYRHVITPYNQLSTSHPMALVSWGKRLEISKVDPVMVINFIRENARHGPEQTSRDGQYEFLLLKHAEIVSDIRDHQLCKPFTNIEK